MNRIHVFAAQVEPLARGDKQLQRRRCADQIGHQINGVGPLHQQVFKVIQDQQQLLLTQHLEQYTAWVATL